MESRAEIADQLRLALRSVPWPVGVLLAHDGVEVRGATVTSFMSVSLTPPLLAVAVGQQRRVFAALEPGAACTLSVLAGGQEHVGEHFGNLVTRAGGVQPVRLGRTAAGLPMVRDALAMFSLRVHERLPAGDHTIVVFEVTGIEQPEEPAEGGEPLLWRDGGYAYLDG